ncbi:hypothetical protein LJB99_07085 [Deltaproteobacteria bacterium OttesenSCG-928-K17]|nr:hypothetical protein [Deltaproteobacteria bacterium OttesenSCG-928-K17]
MQIKGVSRSVAAGVCGQKLIVILRAGGPRQNVGRLAENAFGALGSAGGHRNMARAEIPLENIDQKIRENQVSLSRYVQKLLNGADK